MKKYIWHLILAVLLFTACEEDESFSPPTAGFTVENEGDLRIYDTVQFVNTSTDATSFLWHFGNGETRYGANPTFVYTEPGTYEVSVEATGAGGRALATKSVVIQDGIRPPVASFEITNEGPIIEGDTVFFVNTTNDGSEFLWSFGDADNSTSTEENPYFIYENNGTYEVSLSVKNAKGEDQISQEVVVNALKGVFFIDNTAGKLRRVDLESGEVTDMFDFNAFMFDVVVDTESKRVYYADGDNFAIYSNSLRGGDETLVTDDIIDVRGLALDEENGILYMTDRGDNTIKQVDLSEGTVSTVFSAADGEVGELPTAIDYYNGEIFVTCVEIGFESVWQGAVSGAGLTNTIDFNAGGYGYGIAIDRFNEKMYFDDYWNGFILSANLDGTSVAEVISTTDQSYGIVVDGESGRLYFSGRDGTLVESDLDGSNATDLVTDSNDIRGIFLIK